eukprot:UN31768
MAARKIDIDIDSVHFVKHDPILTQRYQPGTVQAPPSTRSQPGGLPGGPRRYSNQTPRRTHYIPRSQTNPNVNINYGGHGVRKYFPKQQRQHHVQASNPSLSRNISAPVINNPLYRPQQQQQPRYPQQRANEFFISGDYAPLYHKRDKLQHPRKPRLKQRQPRSQLQRTQYHLDRHMISESSDDPNNP